MTHVIYAWGLLLYFDDDAGTKSFKTYLYMFTSYKNDLAFHSYQFPLKQKGFISNFRFQYLNIRKLPSQYKKYLKIIRPYRSSFPNNFICSHKQIFQISSANLHSDIPRTHAGYDLLLHSYGSSALGVWVDRGTNPKTARLDPLQEKGKQNKARTQTRIIPCLV